MCTKQVSLPSRVFPENQKSFSAKLKSGFFGSDFGKEHQQKKRAVVALLFL
jgi:hypothetical protein